MLDEQTLNLINADIDDELTPAEQQQLDDILESSPEARAMRTELLKLSNLLDSVPEQSPPSGLSEKILNQLAPRRWSSKWSLQNLLHSFNPATAGLAFAAGLLLTVGFYEMSPGRGPASDAASMVGTMVAGQGGGMNLLENNLRFSSDGFSGTVSLSENNGFYVMNFDLDSANPEEIVVGLDRTGLSFGGFAETPGSSDMVADKVTISGGTLRLVSQGRRQFTVFLRESSPEQTVAAELITIDFSHGNGHAVKDDSES
jgi:hypothetical protein